MTMARRHEIPTHLNVEDKLLLGLSVRQFTVLLAGASAAYGVWSGSPGSWPAPLLYGLVAVVALTSAGLAFVRPLGRGLEEWAFALAHYWAMPKLVVWRPAEPAPTDWRPDGADWAEFSPRAAWSAGGRGTGVGR
jgi:PrgI family protein